MIATDQNADTEGWPAAALAFLALRDEVLAYWQREVRARVPGASELQHPILINTLPAFYGNLAQALAPSNPRVLATSNNDAASSHGGERARMTTFGPDQVIQEYQILREAIVAETAGRVALGPAEWAAIDLSINTAVVEAVRNFMAIHDALRKRVAASLSHDMRTPLAVIANGAGLIGMATDLAVAKRGAAKIAANAQRLADMVSDLLDALTERGGPALPLELTRFDMQDLVRAVVDEFNEDTPPRYAADTVSALGYWSASAMRRALENLLGNAKKYGDGGVIAVRLQQAHERVVLTVHNMGPHIPQERQALIFDYLQRDPGDAHAPGWGIGLEFVRRVTEGHGGSVVVDSAAETGTTFTVDVPLDCRPYVATRA